ncbi:MAG: hypothetical protein KAJ18_08855 [Candidatus Omnitrophica bacterium]|nr:hypothetical protein [Candidatus Omnitrophota bacterium]
MKQRGKVFRPVIAGVVASMIVVASSGCASIMSGGTQSIQIMTEPVGASVKIYDRQDNLISDVKSPHLATLKRGRGYFKRQKYKIVFDMPGYQTKVVNVKPRLNGWYAGGNLIFGGLVGLLIVDPATGAMWTLTPKEIKENLNGSTAWMKKEKGLLVVLKKDVPSDLLAKMKRVELN